MRLNIKRTKDRETRKVRAFIFALVVPVAIILSSFLANNVNALDVFNQIANLTEEEKIIYSQNDIIFPTSNCVTSSGPSSICGDTPKEMYWSALSQYIDDPVKVAGVMGNLAAEGLFQPVLWEFEYTNDDGTLQASWDKLYNCGNDECPFGVGAFGFTYYLGKYLHAVNDENPDLLKYFQGSVEYSLADADELMKKIGKDDFARLVEFEVRYAIETWEPETTQEYLNQKFSSPSDAAYWWMDRWERPKYRTESERRSAAGKVYDEFKDFSCTPTSSSASTKSATTGINNDITLIGDSIAVQAEAELQAKFPGAFMSKVGSRHTDSKGACGSDESGLKILEKIISGSGTVANQHAGVEECAELKVDSNSFKENIVWELGTNTSGANRENIEDVIKKIGKKNLFLVTPYNGDDVVGVDGVIPKKATDAIASLYRDIAEQHDNVYVVDWNKKVRDSESKYITRDDGMAVHPTAEGRQLLADLISEAVESTASCAMANYKDPAYKKRLEGLDTFHQNDGPWAQHPMCLGGFIPMANHGCGVMSLAAMYYMFSGKGLNDEQVLNQLILATQMDGYNRCNASEVTDYGEKTKEYTGMTMEVLWDDEGLFAYKDSRWPQLVDELKKGKKIMIGTTSPSCSGRSQFAGCAHLLFLDHYNAEKDAVFLYDPSMGSGRATYGTEGPTGDYYDGIYISRKAMDDYVAPDEAFSFTYYGQECEICEESEVGLVEGGMTYEQAVKFMQSYVDEASKQKPGDYGAGSPNGTVIGPGWVSDAGCSGGALNNCVAFSQWFVNNYTTAGLTFGTNHGKGYVDTMISGGFTDGGTTPRAYAVFSTGFEDLYGHTGVVLGINKEKNEIYIGEAGCRIGYNVEQGWPGVHVEDLGEYTGGAYRYAYTDGKLLGGKTIKSMLDSL